MSRYIGRLRALFKVKERTITGVQTVGQLLGQVQGQETLQHYFSVLDSSGPAHRQAEAIEALSTMLDSPNVLSRLYEELCFHERGEVALVAAAALARNIQRPNVRSRLLQGFSGAKNVNKVFGQRPQDRILYAICLSNRRDLLDSLNPSDLSDQFSAEHKTHRDGLIEAARKRDTRAMSRSIAWLEALDASRDPGILLFAANRFIDLDHSKVFAHMAGVEK